MTDCCITDFGAGTWTAYLLDPRSGVELPLERDGWRGSGGRTMNAVSEASIVLDPTYARFLNRRPILWNNELVLRRDGRLEWVGPITSIDDDDTQGVAWTARDRMVWVAERRPFWRSGLYVGESTRLFERVLDAAEFGSPVGLIRDPRPNGVTATLGVTAGDKTGQALSQLGQSLEWTVIGEHVRYGRVSVNAERSLPSDAWGDDRPALNADGFQRLSHVVAVTENAGRVFFPSADPDDRPAGSPLLVDTIDVGNVDIGTAARIARNQYESRQGEISIVPSADRPVDSTFPLQFTELVPGAVLTSSVAGSQLFADNSPVRLETVEFDISDGVESSVLPGLNDAPGFAPLEAEVYELGDVEGIVFPPDAVFPDSQDFDWGDLGFGLGDLDAFVGGLDSIDGLDLSGLTGPLGGLGGLELSGLDSLGDLSSLAGIPAFGTGDLGGTSGPDPGFEPVDFDFDSDLDFDFDDVGFLDGLDEDVYANCPPAECCDICNGGGGGGSGGGGGAGEEIGTGSISEAENNSATHNNGGASASGFVFGQSGFDAGTQVSKAVFALGTLPSGNQPTKSSGPASTLFQGLIGTASGYAFITTVAPGSSFGDNLSSYSHSGTGTYYTGTFVIIGGTRIRESTLRLNLESPTEFPQVNSPGPGFAVAYGVIAPPGTVSPSIDPALTEFDTLGFQNGGGAQMAYEITTAAGVTESRSLSLTGGEWGAFAVIVELGPSTFAAGGTTDGGADTGKSPDDLVFDFGIVGDRTTQGEAIRTGGTDGLRGIFLDSEVVSTEQQTNPTREEKPTIRIPQSSFYVPRQGAIGQYLNNRGGVQ